MHELNFDYSLGLGMQHVLAYKGDKKSVPLPKPSSSSPSGKGEKTKIKGQGGSKQQFPQQTG
jgi:hypothetical protein